MSKRLEIVPEYQPGITLFKFPEHPTNPLANFSVMVSSSDEQMVGQVTVLTELRKYQGGMTN